MEKSYHFNELDLEYFRSIRKEITDRIKIHYTLLGTKLLIIIGVFSFLSQNQDSSKISPFLASALFAFFFDVILVDNLGWIKGAGRFIKKHIEDEKYTNILWEHYFAQPDKSHWCFDIQTYLLGTWSIGTVLLTIGLVNLLLLSFKIEYLSNYLIGGVGLFFGFYSCNRIFKNLGKLSSR